MFWKIVKYGLITLGVFLLLAAAYVGIVGWIVSGLPDIRLTNEWF